MPPNAIITRLRKKQAGSQSENIPFSSVAAIYRYHRRLSTFAVTETYIPAFAKNIYYRSRLAPKGWIGLFQ